MLSLDYHAQETNGSPRTGPKGYWVRSFPSSRLNQLQDLNSRHVLPLLPHGLDPSPDVLSYEQIVQTRHHIIFHLASSGFE